jgi:hypothetical protein
MKLLLKQCLPAIVFSAFVGGCSGSAGDAVGRQIMTELMARNMVSEWERVQISCGTFSDSGTESDIGLSESPPAAEVNVSIRKIEDHRPEKKSVGMMFNWSGKIHLVLDEETKLDTALLGDVKRVLRKNGISVKENPGLTDGPTGFIDIEILEAWVESTPAKWTELRGTIKAIFVFRVVMIKTKTGKLLEKVFRGESTAKTAYFSKRSHEEALGEAYCNSALASFSEFAAECLRD